jgi:glycosyltransferase involved in cell wall biosynthesis
VLSLADGPLNDELERRGVTVWRVLLPESFSSLGEQSGGFGSVASRLGAQIWSNQRVVRDFLRQARGCVAAFAPGIVHSNGQKTHMLARWLAGDTPTAFHFHDFASRRVLSRRLLPFATRGVSTVVAVSEAVASDAASVLPQARVAVLPNVVDTHLFAPGASERANLDELAGLPAAPESTVRIGLVATYARFKGHRVFVEAAALLEQWGLADNVRFYVVGSPIYSTSGSQITRAELEGLARARGIEHKVGFIDFQTAVAAIYRGLSILVHPSTEPEPFGRTLIEAMASGLPVVSTATGGAKEVLSHGGAGLEVAGGSAGSLAAALARLCSDAAFRAELGARGRATAVEHFDHSLLAPRLARIYDELLGCG